MARDTILYVGNFEYPDGNAPGKRVRANGYILRELGYRVVFIGTSRAASSSDAVLTTRRELNGFSYHCFAYPRRIREWLRFNKVFDRMIEFVKETGLEGNLSAVITYSSPSIFPWKLKVQSWCRRKGIAYIEDCGDWLGTPDGSLAFRAGKWIDYTLEMTYCIPRSDGVIVISKYLQDYYRGRGCRTVLIPPLSIDVPYGDAGLNRVDGPIQIVYAGTPFRLDGSPKDGRGFKDRVDKAILYLESAQEAGCRFTFHIYGFTKEQFLQALPSFSNTIDEMGDNLRFHGRVPNEEVGKRVSEADFTMLIRDDNRMTRAGFPTKVSESVSWGTPVIATRTGDLEDYLTDGHQVWWVSFDAKEAAQDVIRALSLRSAQINRMKGSCARSQAFYYGNYITKMKGFLESVLPDRNPS